MVQDVPVLTISIVSCKQARLAAKHHRNTSKTLYFGVSLKVDKTKLGKQTQNNFYSSGMQTGSNKSLSFMDFVTISKATDQKHEQKIIMRKKKPNYDFSGLQPNGNLRDRSSRNNELEHFQNKLITFLQANQTHAKAANKFLQRVGTKESDLLMKVQKPRVEKLPEEITDKSKKKKSIKQYMAEASLSRKKKYGFHSSNSIDVSARSLTQDKKSSSVLIIRKVHKRNSTSSDLDNVSSMRTLDEPGKMPIHHTKTYFFQRKKPMNTRNSSYLVRDSSVSTGNTQLILEGIEPSQHTDHSQFDKYYHGIFSQHMNNDTHLPYCHQQHHSIEKGSFVKMGKKMKMKLSRNGKEPSHYSKTQEEQPQTDIGPWQRRLTVDSEQRSNQ